MKWEDLNLEANIGTPAGNLEVEILSDIFAKIQNLDMSQREMEKITGLKQSSINRLLNAKADPKLITICKLIEPFGYTLKMVKKEEINND